VECSQTQSDVVRPRFTSKSGDRTHAPESSTKNSSAEPHTPFDTCTEGESRELS
jgi:hypothetical protein